MTRRLLNLLTLLSLLLSLATATLWVRLSTHVVDTFTTEHFTVLSVSDGVMFACGFGDGIRGYPPEYRGYRRETGSGDAYEGLMALFAPAGQDTNWTVPGIHYEARSGPAGTTAILFLRYWLLLPLFLIAPSVWTLRRLRKRPPGLCPACGYDLTGNVSGVCPECGSDCA